MEGEEGVAVVSTAEIDTRAPFGSVKEAVMLFGERVLATQVYACTKLKEMQLDDTTTEFEHEEATSELAETKQHLQKAREESMKMAKSLFSLQEELQQTKIELQKLKNVRGSDRHMILDLETLEDIKFVEEDHDQAINRDEGLMMRRKKYVRFANPPCVAQLSVPITSHRDQDELQRQSSIKKKKKIKQIIPFIKGILSKNR